MSELPAVSAARPDWACRLHRPPSPDRAWTSADDGLAVCHGCYSRLSELLQDVIARYRCLDPRLSPTLGGQAGAGGRGAPGFGSRSPGSDHVIVMRDPKSRCGAVAKDGVVYDWDKHSTLGHELPEGVHGPLKAGAWATKRDVWRGGDGKPHSEAERPVRSVATVLVNLADLVADARGIAAPPVPRPKAPRYPQCRLTWTLGQPHPARIPSAVEHYGSWLRNQLPWICEQDWVADVQDELRALQADLKPVTGEPGRKRIGTCPNFLTQPDGRTIECNAALFAPIKGDAIICSTCSREWPRPEWVRLGQILQSGRAA